MSKASSRTAALSAAGVLSGARLMIVAVALLAAGAVSCTLAVDTQAVQCRSDRDCARFAGAVCEVASRICVAARVGGDGGNSGDGAGGGAGGNCRVASGCVACVPPAGLELLNGCSDATCVPFDNRARLANLDADGGLKPLP